MTEYIVDTFGIVQDFADLHGDMSTPLYQAIMDVMVSRQREEIVRCRDCRYRSRVDGTWNPEGYALYCNHWKSFTESNGYCHLGKRRNK